MRHEKLGRELKLMLFLLGEHNLTVSEICSKFELSRRNFYYYMDFFREAGFHVVSIIIAFVSTPRGSIR